MEPLLFKIAKTSDVANVAGAIAKSLREGKSIVIQSIGSDATIKSIKSIALATSYMLEEGTMIYVAAEFFDSAMNVSGIRFTIYTMEVKFPPSFLNPTEN